MPFHEKVSPVKVNVVTEAETKLRRERLLPRFHSHSLWTCSSAARCTMGSVRGGRCNLKCGLCLDQSHLAQSPRPPALGRSRCSSLLHSPRSWFLLDYPYCSS